MEDNNQESEFRMNESAPQKRVIDSIFDTLPNYPLVGTAVAPAISLLAQGEFLSEYLVYGITFDIMRYITAPIDKRKLVKKAKKALGKIRDFPFLWTGLLTAPTIPFLAEGNYQPALTSILMGGSVDAVRAVSSYSRLKDRSPHPLEEILEKEGAQQVIDQVKKRHNLRGHLKTTSAVCQQQGTAPFKRGYFTNIELEFENGKVDLLYKYLDRETSWTGAKITKILRSQGYDFAPFVYDTSRIGLRMFDPNVGTIFENVGKSLESQLFSKGNLRVEEIEDKSFVSEIFNHLFKIYNGAIPAVIENNSGITEVDGVSHSSKYRLPVFKFHERLAADFQTFGDSLDDAFRSELSEDSVVPIHGDMHQGNILEGGKYIIDWDNVQFGLPYHDFFHFAVLSDLERMQGFQPMKEDFINVQGELFGRYNIKKPSDAALKLTEFEVYLSLLNRYNSIMPELKEAHVAPMRNSCRYLLEKATTTLEDFTELTQNPELLNTYRAMVTENFKSLLDVELDERASVAYAHSTYHGGRKESKEDHSPLNFSKHKEKIDKLIVADENLKAPLVWNGLFLSTIVAGTYLSTLGIEDPTEFENTVESLNEMWPVWAAGIGYLLMGRGAKIKRGIKDTYESITSGAKALFERVYQHGETKWHN